MSESDNRPDVPHFVPSPEFLARQKRLDDAMNLRKPDRVPVDPLVVHFYPTKIKGISNKDAMFSPEVTAETWKEATLRHDWDAAVPWGSLLAADSMDILGMKQIKLPGRNLSDDQPFQPH